VYPRYCNISNNLIDSGAGGSNLFIASDYGAYGCVYANNVFSLGTAPGGGIALSGYGGVSGTGIPPQFCTIANNNIADGQDWGICVRADTEDGAPTGNQATDIIIIGNIIGGAIRSGIYLGDVLRATVSGNLIKNWNVNGATQTITGGSGSPVTAASDTQGLFLVAGVPGTSLGCQNVIASGNYFHCAGANQATLFVDMEGSANNIFENNYVTPPTSNPLVIATSWSSTRATPSTTFRNNAPQSTIKTALFTPSPAFTSGTTYTNFYSADIMLCISGGAVSAIAIDGVTIGLTSGPIRWPASSTFKITRTTAPSIVPYYDNP
jgi:hypothetical protein